MLCLTIGADGNAIDLLFLDIVFYAINSALFICLNISLINLICNVLGMRHDIRNHLSEIQLLTVWSLSSKH